MELKKVAPKRPKKKLNGATRRQKGNRGERDVCKKLERVYPDAERVKLGDSLDYHGVDLRNTGPYSIQVKNYKTYCPINKIEEPQVDKVGGIPLLWAKASHKKDVVCMYWDDWVYRETKIKDLTERVIALEELLKERGYGTDGD